VWKEPKVTRGGGNKKCDRPVAAGMPLASGSKDGAEPIVKKMQKARNGHSTEEGTNPKTNDEMNVDKAAASDERPGKKNQKKA